MLDTHMVDAITHYHGINNAHDQFHPFIPIGFDISIINVIFLHLQKFLPSVLLARDLPSSNTSSRILHYPSAIRCDSERKCMRDVIKEQHYCGGAHPPGPRGMEIACRKKYMTTL